MSYNTSLKLNDKNNNYLELVDNIPTCYQKPQSPQSPQLPQLDNKQNFTIIKDYADDILKCFFSNTPIESLQNSFIHSGQTFEMKLHYKPALFKDGFFTNKNRQKQTYYRYIEK